MRKQINGLSILVSAVLELDPFKPAFYAFCNGRRNLLKVLFFDGDGFMMLSKRLEKGHFRWPAEVDDERTLSLDADEFSQFLASTRLERRIARDEVSERSVF
jgi:transposase